MPVTSLQERALAVLNAAAGKPLKAKDVSKLLGLSSDDRSDVRQALFHLADDGRAVALPGRRFVSAASERADLGVKGTVQRKPSGVAWFVPHDKSRKDAFIPPNELAAVVDGDVVLAVITRAPKGPVAQITSVLERHRKLVTGTLRVGHDRRFGRVRIVEVDDNVLSGPVRLEDAPDESKGGDVAKDGDVVEVELTRWPTAQQPALARLVRRLGEKGALDVEIERLVTSAGVQRFFPPAVLDEAAGFGEQPGPHEWRGRQDDLRALPIVTIDGETAKDFDDAVFAKRRSKGGKIDVIVCVADVSHYVQEDAALDREARARGTSIYYPGRVIPMLPEALSNGLCSLRPNVPRLCTAVFFAVDEAGGVHDERLSFAVMQSRARLTYSLVQRFLDEEEKKPEPFAMPPQPKEALASPALLDDETKESLRVLCDASRRLRQARRGRGALDFELPELVIELDEQKEPTGLRHNVRVESQKLIEDLMIAANEAAARFFDEASTSRLREASSPSIYRIHEEPDEEKLGRFLELARPAFIEQTGKGLPKSVMDDPTSPSSLMTLMHGIGEHPSRQALDMLLLRSMKQARYSVDNVGHYGLGSTAYLHFTSPIRRYPDLVVHRLLRARLAGPRRKKKSEDAELAADALVVELEDIAESSSDRERKAAELERQIQQLHACWLMKDRIGEVHEAMVTGVSEAGAFVRLTELHTEGLVRIDALGREYFAFEPARLHLIGERSHDVIAIGARLRVEVADVDLGRRQIAFVRVSDDAPLSSDAPAARKKKARHDDNGDHDVHDDRRGARARRPQHGPPPARASTGRERGRHKDDEAVPPWRREAERAAKQSTTAEGGAWRPRDDVKRPSQSDGPKKKHGKGKGKADDERRARDVRRERDERQDARQSRYDRQQQRSGGEHRGYQQRPPPRSPEEVRAALGRDRVVVADEAPLPSWRAERDAREAAERRKEQEARAQARAALQQQTAPASKPSPATKSPRKTPAMTKAPVMKSTAKVETKKTPTKEQAKKTPTKKTSTKAAAPTKAATKKTPTKPTKKTPTKKTPTKKKPMKKGKARRRPRHWQHPRLESLQCPRRRRPRCWHRADRRGAA